MSVQPRKAYIKVVIKLTAKAMTQIPEQIKKIALVGGTHGNELTGITLIRKFQQNPNLVARNSFKTLMLLGNPKAIEAVTRFQDFDLNRSFGFESLESTADETIYEKGRAKEIYEIFKSENIDAIFDFHSTTAEVGLSIILVNECPFNLHCAAYLSQMIPDLRVCSFFEEGQPSSFLNSLSPNGLAIEVGPIAQGVLDYSLFETTEQLINEILNFVDRWNSGITIPLEPVTVYKKVMPVHFPTHLNELAAFIHPNVKNFLPIQAGDPLFVTFDGQVITLTETQDSEQYYPYLVNEAAYYASNLAFYLMKKTEVFL